MSLNESDSEGWRAFYPASFTHDESHNIL